ncbi:hypothetical protein DMENIID0001_021360 [Sergentomyia squamirostris]
MKKLTDLNKQGRIFLVKMYYYHHMNMDAVKNDYKVSCNVELPTDEAILETVSLFESTGSVLISHELGDLYENSKDLAFDVKSEPQEDHNLMADDDNVDDNDEEMPSVFAIPVLAEVSSSSQEDSTEKKMGKRGRPKKNVNQEKKQQLYKCSECLETFESRFFMRKHRKIQHRSKKNLRCTKCMKYYKTKLYLDLHMKACLNNLPQPENFTCPEEGCGRVLKSMSTMRKHRQTHSERRFICEICGSRFHQQRTLDIHMTVHTGIKPFQCDICAKKFTAKATLRTHIRYHTGERPFKCDFCENAFVDRQTMIVHRRQHTGEQPYSCPYDTCKRFFKQKQNLRSHLKHIHNVQGRPNAKRPCNYELETRDGKSSDRVSFQISMSQSRSENGDNEVQIDENPSSGLLRSISMPSRVSSLSEASKAL